MHFDPDWTVEHAALEVARVAHEGLGHSNLEQLCAQFDQGIQQNGDDQETQIRVVARMLVKLTDSRTGPKDTADTQIGGLCLMWLARTRVREWTVLQLYNWILMYDV